MDFAERYGPWAIIAGATEGTGRAFSRAIAAAGINCILVARRQSLLDDVADELRRNADIQCVTVSADLTLPDVAERIAAGVGDREVGLLINNAGSDPNASHFLDTDLENWLALVNRNVLAVMRNCYRFAPPMKARGRGGIIIVGSGACYGGASAMGVYAGSKAFDLCFGEGLWAELKPHGVDVLNMILGRTNTDAFRRMLARNNLPLHADIPSPEDVVKVALERLPYGPNHNWGQADDAAGFYSHSAAERRERVLAIDERSAQVLGKR